MRKLLLTISLLVFCIIWAKAQEVTNTFTLQQCLNYAYEHAATVKKAEYDTQIAKARVNETKGIGLPQISGTGQLLYNFELRPAFVPPAFAGGDPTAPQDPNAEFVPLKGLFAPDYQGELGVSVSQIIFSGSYFVGLQAAKTYTQLAQRSLDASKITVAENVTKAYFSLLVAKERITLLDKNLARLDSSLSDLRAINKQGLIETLDVQRLEVAYNNLVAERLRIERLISLSNELLKFQMGMPASERLEIQGSIRDYQLETINEEFIKADYKNRAEYLTLDVSRQLTELDLKNKRIAAYPSLVAIGQYGYATGARFFKNVWNFGDRWLSYGTVGLQLNIPIFDGLQRKYSVQQTRLELLKLEQDKLNLERAIDLEANQAQISLRNAATALDIQRRNMELAQEVLRVTQLKYKQGLGANLEVVEAEADYKEAETNYYGALYDALVAKVDLDKALGRLGNTK